MAADEAVRIPLRSPYGADDSTRQDRERRLAAHGRNDQMKSRVQRSTLKYPADTKASIAVGRRRLTLLVVALVALMTALLVPPAIATVPNEPTLPPAPVAN